MGLASFVVMYPSFVLLVYQLFDEYQNLGLLRASFEASNCPDYGKRSEILNTARRVLQASSVSFASVVSAAAALYKKPVRIDFEVCGCSC
jgi:hypothetical protein